MVQVLVKLDNLQCNRWYRKLQCTGLEFIALDCILCDIALVQQVVIGYTHYALHRVSELCQRTLCWNIVLGYTALSTSAVGQAYRMMRGDTGSGFEVGGYRVRVLGSKTGQLTM